MGRLTENLSQAVTIIKEWLQNHGFDICTEKSQVTFFSRSQKVPNNSVTLANLSFPIKDQAKYLGLLLDRKLLWSNHFNYLTAKCEKALNIFRLIAKQNWGADATTCVHIYKSLIRSRIDYVCTLYGSASKFNLKRVDVIQGRCNDI